MKPTLLSFGHGYSAQVLAKELLSLGWRVIGTTRSTGKAEILTNAGIDTVIWPGDDLRAEITAASHILVSAAPGETGDPILKALETELRRASHLKWVGYLSTTGVYGDHAGGWVDEATPLTPTTRRGALRKSAEAQWQAMGLPLHIFRLAGIYGPGRGPFAKVRNKTARRIIKPGQVFSRIHVEDIAQVLIASIQSPRPGAIYNVCDDDPAPPEDAIGYAAELLGLPLPPEENWETAEMTQMARSFYAESKKVRNDLIKTELGVSLRYPNYRVGLQSLLQAEPGESGQ
jgi:nucleoside-diphosphate-sugar epimerase